MPARSSSNKDQEFGAKLDHLAGVIGYLHPPRMFQNSFLAKELNVDPPRMRRKRTGVDSIDLRDLSVLIALFNLGDRLDYTLFLLPLKEFKQELKRQGIGTYSGRSGLTGRQTLMNLSNDDDPSSPECSIAIKLKSVKRRSPGMGNDISVKGTLPVFKDGDAVTIDIAVPRDGYLTVVEDELGITASCIMPSKFAPLTAVKKGRVSVPNGDGDGPLVINGVSATYRVFAIWTAEQLLIPGQPNRDMSKVQPWIIDGRSLDSFASQLMKRRPEHRAVAAIDYRIVD